MAPPYKQIDPPISYAEWSKTKELFPDGTQLTRTRVFDDPKTPGMRITYGYTKVQEFWFFVQMTGDEEKEFMTIYADWRRKQTGDHQYQSYDTKPPACGTPNTPVCPPDPGLSGAISNLAELVAGAGATKDQVTAAELQVVEMLMQTIEGATALIEKKY